MSDRKKKISHCPTCGARTNSHKHSLSGVLMRGFRKILANSDEIGRFDISDCDLTYSERENSRKLQYWNIIEKQRDDKMHGGQWRVTVNGLAFAEGMTELNYSAITYRGTLVKYTGRRVYIQDVAGGWKYRPDYARDARPFLAEPEQHRLIP